MLKIRPQVGKFYKRMIKKSREIACFLSKRLQKIEGSSQDSRSSIDWITIGNIIGPLPMLAPTTTLMMNVFSVFSRQEAKTRNPRKSYLTDQLMKVTFSARLSRLTAVSFPHKSFYFSAGIATRTRPSLSSDLLQNPEIALLSWKITLNRTWNGGGGKGKSFMPRKLEIDFLPILSTAADFLFQRNL